ncbi:MAG: alkaline phosphatase family protein [Cyclobacteriaceae bacterium]
MNLHSKILSIFILFLFGTLGCKEIPTLQSQYVVIIGIDGMSPAGLRKANAPNIKAMMEKGSYSMQARAIRPTSSSSNWASMLMGAGPDQHGITSNDWERDEFEIYPSAVGVEDVFPSIFSLLYQQKKDKSTTLVALDWKPLGRFLELSIMDWVVYGETPTEVTTNMVEKIISEKPTLAFIQLDHVDGALHRHGHLAEGYLQTINHADSLAGLIIEAYKEAGIFEKTTFIIASDHGGLGYGHGGDSMDELQIPVIISGPDVKENFEITDPVYVYDIAATTAHLLGLKIPRAWIGKPTVCAFIGNNCEEYNRGSLTKQAPVIQPEAVLYQQAGGLYIAEKPRVIIESDNEDDIIRYTTNGISPDNEDVLYEAPFELDKTTIVMARAFDASGNPSQVQKAYFRIIDKDRSPGVQYKYYEGGPWSKIPDFNEMEVSRSGSCYEFRVQDDMIERRSHYGFTMQSNIQCNEAGKYVFYTSSDDGSKLFVNNQLVVNNDGDHGLMHKAGSIRLKPGMHEIRIEYFNGGGSGWLEAYWKGPGIPKQIISADRLHVEKQLATR